MRSWGCDHTELPLPRCVLAHQHLVPELCGASRRLPAGCVNTVHFSPDGRVLVSGSDDQDIRFWDWQTGTTTLRCSRRAGAQQAPAPAQGACVRPGQSGPPTTQLGPAALRCRWASGHTNNVFQARVMPESCNKTVISCAADGQVRF